MDVKGLVAAEHGGAYWAYDEDLVGKTCWDCGTEFYRCEGHLAYRATMTDPEEWACPEDFPILHHATKECRATGVMDSCCQSDEDIAADYGDYLYDARRNGDFD